jgi:phosphopantetheine adenylyltransferase
MGIMNRKLCGIETVFLLASTGRTHISSSMIRELSVYKKRLENFVPPEIEDEVYEYLFDYYDRNIRNIIKK